VSLPSIRSLTTTAEERAIGFFSNLVTCLFGTCQDYLDYVPDLSNKNVAGEHLFASIRAVGLAGFSNVVHSPELIARAQLPDPTYEKLYWLWPNRPFDVRILPGHVQNRIYYFELFWGLRFGVYLLRTPMHIRNIRKLGIRRMEHRSQDSRRL
jgi:hypothetical protein